MNSLSLNKIFPYKLYAMRSLCKILFLILIYNQVEAAKTRALIYNKDGKFIYRPAKSSQGHIIVIDDRHHHHHGNHENRADEFRQHASSNMGPIFQQPVHILSPRAQLQTAQSSLLQPSAGLFHSGALQPQLIQVNDLQAPAPVDSRYSRNAANSVLNPSGQIQIIPLVQFYPAAQQQVTMQPQISALSNRKPLIYDNVGQDIAQANQQNSLSVVSEMGQLQANSPYQLVSSFRPTLRERAFNDALDVGAEHSIEYQSLQQNLQDPDQPHRRWNSLPSSMEFDESQVFDSNYRDGNAFEDSPAPSGVRQSGYQRGEQTTRESRHQASSMRNSFVGKNFDSSVPGFIPKSNLQSHEEDSLSRANNLSGRHRQESGLTNDDFNNRGNRFPKPRNQQQQLKHKGLLEPGGIKRNKSDSGSLDENPMPFEQTAHKDANNYWSQFKNQYEIV